MSHIPFIEARFFCLDDTSYTLEKRFAQHLRDLRNQKLVDTGAGAEKASDNENAARRRHFTSPSEQERAQIKRRVALLLERRKAASGIQARLRGSQGKVNLYTLARNACVGRLAGTVLSEEDGSDEGTY